MAMTDAEAREIFNRYMRMGVDPTATNIEAIKAGIKPAGIQGAGLQGGGAAPAIDRAKVLMDVIAGKLKGMQAETLLNRVGASTSVGTSYPMTALESAIAGGRIGMPPGPVDSLQTQDDLFIALAHGAVPTAKQADAKQMLLQHAQSKGIQPAMEMGIRGY